MKPSELPAHHVGYDKNGSGWRLDCPGGVTVRMEGGTKELRQATAYRLAFCWNMNEGLPIESLEAGKVGDLFIAARELAAAVRQATTELAMEYPHGKNLKALVAAFEDADKALAAVKIECTCRERHPRNEPAEPDLTESAEVSVSQAQLFEETP